MHNITLISTVHKEIGKCNADELCRIIEKINPEVIFLEALDETYSNYENVLFESYGVFHKKLEIAAIQKYRFNASFKYVPVLDVGLSEAFERKSKIVCENTEYKNWIDNFESLISVHGFKLLNSVEAIKLQEERRMLENRILNGSEVSKAASEVIEAYENSMMRNIYSYCKNNQFNTAIFMCGVGHRKSLLEKIGRYSTQEQINLSWTVFEN